MAPRVAGWSSGPYIDWSCRSSWLYHLLFPQSRDNWNIRQFLYFILFWFKVRGQSKVGVLSYTYFVIIDVLFGVCKFSRIKNCFSLVKIYIEFFRTSRLLGWLNFDYLRAIRVQISPKSAKLWLSVCDVINLTVIFKFQDCIFQKIPW